MFQNLKIHSIKIRYSRKFFRVKTFTHPGKTQLEFMKPGFCKYGNIIDF